MNPKTKSSKPRKQRAYRRNAPHHIRKRFMRVHLYPDLREEYQTRSMLIHVGDTVKILSGDFKGAEGKVTEVDYKKLRVYVEGIVRTKRDGSEALAPLSPSNLMIMSLNMTKSRKEALAKKGKLA